MSRQCSVGIRTCRLRTPYGFRFLVVMLVLGLVGSCMAAFNGNTYVTVESTTQGVEDIYSVRDDFYVTTRKGKWGQAPFRVMIFA